MERHERGKTEVLEAEPVCVPLCPPEIPYGQARDQATRPWCKAMARF